MARRNSTRVRFFTEKGEEVDYDYFKNCFSTFDILVTKAQKYMPGIEADFIKYLIKDNKYGVGGCMLKPDGSKVRLYYLAKLCQLLLVRDKSGFYLKDSNGNYIWKPKAYEYYQNWKTANKTNKIQAVKNDDAKHRAFLNNISRYDPDMKPDDDD
jgi:hypothetical protein